MKNAAASNKKTVSQILVSPLSKFMFATKPRPITVNVIAIWFAAWRHALASCANRPSTNIQAIASQESGRTINNGKIVDVVEMLAKRIRIPVAASNPEIADD